MKVFNFFAGVEIDDLEPNLPNMVVPASMPGADGDSDAGDAGGTADLPEMPVGSL